MKYKYVIRKVRSNNRMVYIPLVFTGGYWRYLRKTGDKFLASKKNKVEFNQLIDAYKFIAEHRMKKESKGKDRDKCMYYKEGLSFAPFLGISYMIKGFTSGVPFRYLFSSPLSMGTSIGFQVFLIIISLIIIL